jgi:hypothetical protein
MKKTNNIISITYSVANTNDSINDAIGRQIHEVEAIEGAAKIQRETLCAFIKENREAIDVDAVALTLKANGYSKQAVQRLFAKYGIVRRPQKKSEVSKEMQSKAVSELAAFRKKYGKDTTAMLRRMYDLARESK